MATSVSLTPAEIVTHLAATRTFALLEPGQLAGLAPLFDAVRHGAGRTVASAGDVDHALVVVAGGSLTIEAAGDDPAEPVGILRYGGVIGERGVFTGAPRTTSLVAMEPTLLLRADRDALWAALAADLELLDRLLLADATREQMMRLPPDGTGALEGELVVATIRRHWLALFRSLVPPLAFVLLTVPAAVLLAGETTSSALILGLAVVALAVPVLGAVWAFLDYWRDALILSTRRIVHVEQRPLIDARRSEAMLERIQDVRVVQPSVWAKVFGYGTITIQTAGSRGAIRFGLVPAPSKVRQQIFDQVERATERAHAERQAWIVRQVRVAIGLDAESGAEDTAPEHDESAEPAGHRPGAMLLAPLRYLVPKMRVQEGATVTLRKHWWVLLKHTWFLLAPLAALSIVLAGLLRGRASAVPGGAVDDGLAGSALASLAGSPETLVLVALAVNVVALLWQYEDWRNDLYQLSDNHVVDIEAMPLGLFKEGRQANLGQIQDVRFVVPNPLAKLLGYGDLVIETAAEMGNFTFDHVSNPAGVQEEIMSRIEQQRARAQRSEEKRRADEMRRWIGTYHRVVGESGAGPGAPPDAAGRPGLPD